MVNVRLIYLRVGATRLRRDHRCAVQALLDSGETIAGSWGRRASRLGVARACGASRVSRASISARPVSLSGATASSS